MSPPEASGFFPPFPTVPCRPSATKSNPCVAIPTQMRYTMAMKTILTPVDFSPATAHVIDAAIDLATAVDGKVVLLHANQPPTVTADYGLAMENVQEIISVSEKASSRQLEHLLRQLSDRGVDASTASISGPAVASIVARAKETDASYIVMGSHGHTALYDLLVGSTTHGVLKKAPCPVVIVPPGES